MTISSYQVDNVLRIYTRQNNAKPPAVSRNDSETAYRDKVTLSDMNENKTGAYEKISYNIMDIILANKKEK